MAIFLPRSCSTEVISGLTTRATPPEAAPETTRTASPLDLEKAFTVGFGPMYVASSAPEKIASIAAGPALKVFVSSLTSLPSFSAKMPCSTPTTAGAWVMLGK